MHCRRAEISAARVSAAAVQRTLLPRNVIQNMLRMVSPAPLRGMDDGRRTRVETPNAACNARRARRHARARARALPTQITCRAIPTADLQVNNPLFARRTPDAGCAKTVRVSLAALLINRRLVSSVRGGLNGLRVRGGSVVQSEPGPRREARRLQTPRPQNVLQVTLRTGRFWRRSVRWPAARHG